MNKQLNHPPISLLSHQSKLITQDVANVLSQESELHYLQNDETHFTESELESHYERLDEQGAFIRAYIVLPSLHSPQRLTEMTIAAWQSDVVDLLKALFLYAQVTIQECIVDNRECNITFINLQKNHMSLVNHVVEDSLKALTRSIAKEYGRKEIYSHAVSVNSIAQLSSMHELLLSPGMRFCNGEYFNSQKSNDSKIPSQ